MITLDLYNEIFSERGYMCECNCGGRGEDLHHALIGRKKRFPELDCKENLIIVNHLQHISRKFDNKYWREYFWKVQVDRYGYEHMINWVNNLPTKIKPRMNWVQEAMKG